MLPHIFLFNNKKIYKKCIKYDTNTQKPTQTKQNQTNSYSFFYVNKKVYW